MTDDGERICWTTLSPLVCVCEVSFAKVNKSSVSLSVSLGDTLHGTQVTGALLCTRRSYRLSLCDALSCLLSCLEEGRMGFYSIHRVIGMHSFFIYI